MATSPGNSPIREKRVATGIFIKRTIRLSGGTLTREQLEPWIRRQNEDALKPLAALEEHAVSIVRRFGSAVIHRPGGFAVLQAPASALAQLKLPRGAKLLLPTPVPIGKPGAVKNPEYEDACDILAQITGIRVAIDRGDAQQLIKDSVRLGMAAVRLKVRPFEDDARIGRSLVEGQRKRAMKRHRRTSAKDEVRIAAFDRFRPTAGSDNDAVEQAAEACGCVANTIRNALERADRPLPKRPSGGKPPTPDSLQRRRS
jgi:hypothetical protein